MQYGPAYCIRVIFDTLIKPGYIHRMNANATNRPPEPNCTAFEGSRLIASGQLRAVVAGTKAVIDGGASGPVLIFDDTSQVIEIDFRGTQDDVLARLALRTQGAAATGIPAEPETLRRGPGRPRLGVVPREVTLLPRHWDWLAGQPGGASVALRKLVDEARRERGGADRLRRGQESLHRFITVMAGNAPGYEEATRALFAGDRTGFDALVEHWPADVRDHTRRLAGPAFESERASDARGGA